MIGFGAMMGPGGHFDPAMAAAANQRRMMVANALRGGYNPPGPGGTVNPPGPGGTPSPVPVGPPGPGGTVLGPGGSTPNPAINSWRDGGKPPWKMGTYSDNLPNKNKGGGGGGGGMSGLFSTTGRGTGGRVQMGFGDALGALLNGVTGGSTPKGFMAGPGAERYIPGWKPGDVRAVMNKNQGGGKKKFNLPRKV
jgi:hypothetical protein